MRIQTEADVTNAVQAVMAQTTDPRLREIMTSLIAHLHGFVRDVRLTEPEFRKATALINAIGFHVLPSLRAGAPNPGLFTAAALYVPIGIWAYVAASSDDRLSFGAFVLSVLVGATVMAAAVGMLILGRDYGYADAAEDEAGPPPIPGTHAEAETGGDDGD